jgi:hypothetical protein
MSMIPVPDGYTAVFVEGDYADGSPRFRYETVVALVEVAGGQIAPVVPSAREYTGFLVATHHPHFCGVMKREDDMDYLPARSIKERAVKLLEKQRIAGTAESTQVHEAP